MEAKFVRAFNFCKVVTCGFCRGTGSVTVHGESLTCYYCEGSGRLLDVRKGTVNLYPKNTTDEDDNGQQV